MRKWPTWTPPYPPLYLAASILSDKEIWDFLNLYNLYIMVRNECKVETQTVTKYMPMTSCEKVPRQLCAPANCGFKEVRSSQAKYFRAEKSIRQISGG